MPHPSPLNADPIRQRLLTRIGRRYQVVIEEVTVDSLTFPFTRIADPDVVLDQVAAEEDRLTKLSGKKGGADHLRLPYWAELWDSALGIAQTLARQRPDRPEYAPIGAQQRLSVLDLGCGMGLAGTVAAKLGMRVLFADIEPDSLLFAKLNSLADADRIRTRRLDWQTDRLAESFDLILGADILYERKQWDHLEPFWRAHLSPTGNILLAEPGRQSGDLFDAWIRTRGWRVEVHQEKVATRETPIRIFELRHPSPE